jgi:hypothetical protein
MRIFRSIGGRCLGFVVVGLDVGVPMADGTHGDASTTSLFVDRASLCPAECGLIEAEW